MTMDITLLPGTNLNNRQDHPLFYLTKEFTSFSVKQILNFPLRVEKPITSWPFSPAFLEYCFSFILSFTFFSVSFPFSKWVATISLLCLLTRMPGLIISLTIVLENQEILKFMHISHHYPTQKWLSTTFYDTNLLFLVSWIVRFHISS